MLSLNQHQCSIVFGYAYGFISVTLHGRVCVFLFVWTSQPIPNDHHSRIGLRLVRFLTSKVVPYHWGLHHPMTVIREQVEEALFSRAGFVGKD